MVSTTERDASATGGFTLLEVLIGIVILCLLAAAFVPQLSAGGDGARIRRLCGILQRVRAQIAVYEVQHNERLPGTTPGVTFEQAMTEKTDVAGYLDKDGCCGPYLEEMPVNPFNNRSEVRTDGAAAGADTHGWRYDTKTGDFQADDSTTHARL